MKSRFFTSGCVERAYSHGKSGFIRDVVGTLYYFTESSFTDGITSLKEGSSVIFKADTVKNEKSNTIQLFASDVSFD